MTRTVYDAMIIGGGPAGLSAAVYLGRFLRSTIVIDSGDGRSSGQQINENYLGFPRGVRAGRLRALGRAQAQRFGVRFVDSSVSRITQRADGFVAEGGCGTWHARTVIFATGVTDVWPSVPDVGTYVGRSLFWCITCDGFRTRGQRTMLIAGSDAAASTACQFLVYTDRLSLIALQGPDGTTIGPEKRGMLQSNGITVIDGALNAFRGRRGRIREVVVDGKPHAAEVVFSLLGAVPNSQLAAQVGVLLDGAGYIRIDGDQHTNVPRVYAAGDVTGPYAHQVSSAVHEGAMAAQSANYDLYAGFQRDEP